MLSGPGWSSPRVLLNQFPSVCVCFLFSSFGFFSFFPFLDHFLSCRAAAVASCVHLFFFFFGVYTPSLVFLYVKWSGGSLFRCLLVDSFDLYVKGLGGNLSRVVFRSLGLSLGHIPRSVFGSVSVNFNCVKVFCKILIKCVGLNPPVFDYSFVDLCYHCS